jgi:HK97 family phage major capsid protein
MPQPQVSIDRTGAATLIPIEYASEIIKNVTQKSVVLSYGRRLPNMSTSTRVQPVLNTLPTAYFLTGDTAQKQTTKLAWASKTITAEELAVIVPIPQAVLDDSNYDIYGETRPALEEAFGVAIDNAVIHGTNKPASWPAAIVTDAIAQGNMADLSVIVAASGDVYDAIMGPSGTIGLLETDGYMPTGHIAAPAFKSTLRSLRDTTKQPIFKASMQDSTRYELDGAPLTFPLNGVMNAVTAMLISGDWTQLVYAMRQDITFTVLKEAVIQNPDGTIAYNLAQQDMVALRAVMRIGVQIANPINAINSGATRYPFSILQA